jgi:hypothetical protein
LSYIVSFDEESGKYEVRRSKTHFPVGKGDSLYSAVDDLETKVFENKKEALASA